MTRNCGETKCVHVHILGKKTHNNVSVFRALCAWGRSTWGMLDLQTGIIDWLHFSEVHRCSANRWSTAAILSSLATSTTSCHFLNNKPQNRKMNWVRIITLAKSTCIWKQDRSWRSSYVFRNSFCVHSLLKIRESAEGFQEISRRRDREFLPGGK